jgi:hypothetical protein
MAQHAAVNRETGAANSTTKEAPQGNVQTRVKSRRPRLGNVEDSQESKEMKKPTESRGRGASGSRHLCTAHLPSKDNHLVKASRYALPLDEPCFEITPQSQGRPHLEFKRLKGQQEWDELEMLEQCPEHGVSVGQSVGLHVINGPPRGKVLQIRRPDGEEHVQVLVALIWERSRIVEDAKALEHLREPFLNHLNKVWPRTEKSFTFMVSTEFRVLTCSAMRGVKDPFSVNIENHLCPHLVYHRPFDTEETKIFDVPRMEEFFVKGAPFWQIRF